MKRIFWGICLVTALLRLTVVYAASKQQNNDERLIDKKEARDVLLNEHYIKWDDLDEFKYALYNNKAEIVDLFMRSGTNPGYYYICDLIEKKRFAMLKLLLNYPDKIGSDSGPWLGDKEFYKHDYNSCLIGSRFSHVIAETNNQISHLSTDCKIQENFVNVVAGEKLIKRNVEENTDNCGDCLDTLCADSVKKFTEAMPEKSYIFMQYVMRDFLYCAYNDSKCMLNQTFWDVDNQQYLADLLAYLNGVNQDQCDKKNLKSCQILKKYNEHFNASYQQALLARKNQQDEALRKKEEIENKAKQDAAYRNSEKYILESACSIVENQKFANDMANREYRIGAKTGFVNAGNLYTAGQIQVYNEDRLIELKGKYRRKTGRELNLEQCH